MAASMQDEVDDGCAVLMDLADICADPPIMRDKCQKCKRPVTVCWCPYLPLSPPNTRTQVYILQHPFEADLKLSRYVSQQNREMARCGRECSDLGGSFPIVNSRDVRRSEESRRLQTARMLYHGLPPGHCHIIKGKRFNCTKNPELSDIIDDPDTYLLYPGPKAQELSDVAAERRLRGCGPCKLVLLDGTWAQARGIYTQNRFLHSMQQVQLSNTGLSEYVIRTQPMDGCLSTLETAAISIALLEQRPELPDILIEPLRALCNFQLNHGAVEHQSKQYLIENGLYKKQEPKKPKDTTKRVGNTLRPDGPQS